MVAGMRPNSGRSSGSEMVLKAAICGIHVYHILGKAEVVSSNLTGKSIFSMV